MHPKYEAVFTVDRSSLERFKTDPQAFGFGAIRNTQTNELLPRIFNYEKEAVVFVKLYNAAFPEGGPPLEDPAQLSAFLKFWHVIATQEFTPLKPPE